MIAIKRNTGWIGMASRIKLIVNGQKIAYISEGKTIEIELHTDVSSLKSTQFGVRSNEVSVKDGDILEIHQTLYYRMSLPIILVIPFLNVYIPGLYDELIPLLCFFVLISMFFIKGFNIKIISREVDNF